MSGPLTEVLISVLAGALGAVAGALAYYLGMRRVLRRREEETLFQVEAQLNRRVLERQKEFLRTQAGWSEGNEDLSLLLARAGVAIDAGVPEAAVILSSGVLEEYLRRTVAREEHALPFGSLVRSLAESSKLDPRMLAGILKLWKQRNDLVHHQYSDVITEHDARRYVDSVGTIVSQLSNTARAEAASQPTLGI